MTRSLTGPQTSAVQAGTVGLLIFVEMLFDSGTLRVCSAGYDFAWGGNTWVGVGQLGAVEPVREAETGEVSGLAFSLSGVPSTHISIAMNEAYQGRTVRVYVGLLDANYALIGTPVLEWEGSIDIMAIEDNGQTSTIRVTAENELFDFERPNVLLLTDEDQQKLFTGDLGLQYAAQMVDRPLVWPSAEYFKRG